MADTRLIDANALYEYFEERKRWFLNNKEKAILEGDEERKIRADAILAFLSEVRLVIADAPTIQPVYNPEDMANAYHEGRDDGRDEAFNKTLDAYLQLGKRILRLEQMVDLLGNVSIYTPSCGYNQRAEYECRLNQIHDELWRED